VIDAQGEIEGDLRKRVQMDIKRLMDIAPTVDCDIGAVCQCATAHAH